MKSKRTIALLLIFLVSVTGCSGYLAEDYDKFQIRMADDHPIGSDVSALLKDLTRRGFKLTGPAFKPSPNNPEPLQNCLQKPLAYGFWGGGNRYVCYKPMANGKISDIRMHQLVAGL